MQLPNPHLQPNTLGVAPSESAVHLLNSEVGGGRVSPQTVIRAYRKERFRDMRLPPGLRRRGRAERSSDSPRTYSDCKAASNNSVHRGV